MVQFQPFEIDGIPMDEQFMNWNEMVKQPFNKDTVDAYTRTRVILMNGIENNSILVSHNLERMIGNEEILRQLALLRRADSQQQVMVNWLIPANESLLETTIAFEQVAVNLTANLAKNEPDKYFKQVLDYALLEDFDHLFRYGCLMELIEGRDPNSITQGYTDIKPGRPTAIEHRHPFQSMRKHYDKDKATLKTKMNYHTIVSAEQQTMLLYRTNGNMYADELARKLYAEIAEIEEQHVTEYELVGDPRESPLERLALLHLTEAYNYFSCAITETDERFGNIWERCCEMEITHFLICGVMLKQFEQRNIRDIMKTNVIEPIIVFEPNKEYVNHLIATQVELEPLDKEFVEPEDLPADWPSFAYRAKVNAGGIPSEQVVNRASQEGKLPKAA